MKVFAFIAAAFVATTSAFTVPSSQARYATALSAEKGKPLLSVITNLDLFDPKSNTYGARKQKKIGLAKIKPGLSYVPDGLTAAEYAKKRAEENFKKDMNYEKNAKKAFKYQDFTDFYLKRGTELTQGWLKDINRGHTMVKTKYDWSGKKIESKGWFTPPKEKK